MVDLIACVFILSYFKCLGLLGSVAQASNYSKLGMLVNLVQYIGKVGVFNDCKLQKKMVAKTFYSSRCGFNVGLAVFGPVFH